MIFMTGSPALESALAAIEYGAFRYLVEADRARRDDGGGRARAVARAQAGARPARGGARARARGEADRRSRRPRGAVRLGASRSCGWRRSPSCRGRGAARSPTRRCCAPTSRRCAARSTSSTPPSGWAGGRARTDHPPARGEAPDRDAAAGAPVRQPAPGRSRGRGALRRRRRADAVRQAAWSWRSPSARRSIGSTSCSTRVKRLRALGYRIAIDDLGAGYAGLTSFAQLEPEVVKVDMSLVRGIDGSPIKQKLVRSIIALCTELGIQLVAEGIETPAERDCADLAGRRSLPGLPLRQAGPRLPDSRPQLASVAAGPAAPRPAPSVAARAPSLSMTWVATRTFSAVGSCACTPRLGLGPAEPVARHRPGDLRLGRGGHHDEAVELALAAALDQQRRLVERQRGAPRRPAPPAARRQRAAMRGCSDRLQPRAGRRIGEDDRPQPLAVDGCRRGPIASGQAAATSPSAGPPGATTSRASSSASTTGTPRAAIS